MLLRQPVAAGRFYPADADALRDEVRGWLALGAEAAFRGKNAGQQVAPEAERLFGAMLPHAGYVYCGRVMGATLHGLPLPRTLLILCPNHTGRGEPLGVWPRGAWLTPLGPMPVDAALAARICAADHRGGFAPDTLSHLGEHSIEVLLPFLQCLAADGQPVRIVPISVGTQQPSALRAAGQALAETLGLCAQEDGLPGVIVSSDMNHYESESRTREKDALALERALACDPEGLLSVIARENISMCGAGPLALALFAAQHLGAPRAELVLHETSAAAAGETEHVVGYAGLHLWLEPFKDNRLSR